MTEPPAATSFRLAYVPGVTPGKWVRTWEQRLPQVPLALVPVPAPEGPRTLLDGGADAGLVRQPVDRDLLHAIPLYTETTVVVIPKDHWLAAADEVAPDDLAEEIVLHPLDDTLDWPRPPGQPAIERPASTADAIELVAAGIGVLAVPQSLARLHHRRDLTYRTLTDAPQSQVVLSWLQERTTDLVEEFIGIVRGRTVNSSRGRAQAPAPAGSAQQPQQRQQRQQSQQSQRSQKTKSERGQAQSGGRAAGRTRGKPRRRS